MRRRRQAAGSGRKRWCYQRHTKHSAGVRGGGEIASGVQAGGTSRPFKIGRGQGTLGQCREGCHSGRLWTGTAHRCRQGRGIGAVIMLYVLLGLVRVVPAGRAVMIVVVADASLMHGRMRKISTELQSQAVTGGRHRLHQQREQEHNDDQGISHGIHGARVARGTTLRHGGPA